MSVDDEWCSWLNRKLWNDGESVMSWWVVCGAGYMRCHNFRIDCYRATRR